MSNLNDERLGVRIGRLVREARTRQNMKLTDLATKVGRTAAQLSTLERGIYQWTDSVLDSCAQALDIPLASLFAEEDELVLKLPRDPEVVDLSRKLADRLRDASPEEIRGLLVWSEVYRDKIHNDAPSPSMVSSALPLREKSTRVARHSA